MGLEFDGAGSFFLGGCLFVYPLSTPRVGFDFGFLGGLQVLARRSGEGTNVPFVWSLTIKEST